MNGQLLTVSTSPHLLGSRSIRSMNLEYMIALLPALLTGLYYFGSPALMLVLISTGSAVVVEYVITLILKKKPEVDNLHAALMGFMLGLILPAGAPWWIPVIGAGLAIVLGKLCFGGMGAYPMNPVLIAWAALSLSWPEHMSAFVDATGWGSEEWVLTGSPLVQLKDDIGALQLFEMGNLWKGAVPAAIGAGGTWALLLGGLYLVFRRIVAWQIPLGVILGAVIMSLLAAYTDPRVAELGLEGFSQNFDVVLFQLATGGLMIVAFFLAPEPVTSPMTGWGTFLFGLGIGCIAIIVRMWGKPVDGAYYGVLLMNAATPLLDRIKPRVIGKVVSGA
ncbi:MAG: RnfABCDGE type electron transport complex subunit D [Deltaproteobacteria bacterium]|nr:RnfABCDGE type electron transport complex subunit D [Deltaproteobacteria bacterium]